ncbi:hypothetical protein AZZ72_002919, partial [Klebsiella pneumoniae]
RVSNDVMNITILSQTPWLMLFRMQGHSFASSRKAIR